MAKKKSAPKKATPKKAAPKKSARKKAVVKKKKRAEPKAPAPPGDDIRVVDGDRAFRARVRMFRQGLGDCFLLTFPRAGKRDFQMLIDCGVLQGDSTMMQGVAKQVRDAVRDPVSGKAILDVVVGTHEHKDHLSGFNQARAIFDEIDIRAVWLGWTENLDQDDIRKIKQAKRKIASGLQAALDDGFSSDDVRSVLAFNEGGTDDEDDDAALGLDGAPAKRTIADALEYLKFRGRQKQLRFLEPGDGPLSLDIDGDEVADLRVYSLGPPRDPILLKSSEVTKQMEDDEVVYHLSSSGAAGLAALSAMVPLALDDDDPQNLAGRDRFAPFSTEYRIFSEVESPVHRGRKIADPRYEVIQDFVEETYDDPDEAWRRIDDDWEMAVDQLALDLDSDTNNTSLVLAFEFVSTGEVLLFVGDAQVGNWQSWANVEFQVKGEPKPIKAHDLLSRTIFYKVGHHCSHNATIRKGGLELMTRKGLVAFIPLEKKTASLQGKKINGKPKGWAMPAKALYQRLKEITKEQVVISDRNETLTPAAKAAGVVETPDYIDYFLK